MENRIDILEELKELSPAIAAIEKVNVFTVPDGYFEHLCTDIMTGIQSENGSSSDFTAIISSAEVPSGYFNTLADTILNKIKANEAVNAATEIRALSPMLYSIQNENVFDVPHGYFENFSNEVLDKLKPQPKVINMQRRSSTFFKYAIAAAFTGVMALGVFKFTQPPTDFVFPDYVKIGMKMQNVDEELAKISDAEIVKYLEASGTDVNAAFVANSVDDNELPAQEDYLLDDEALDKYLNSINLDNLKN